MATGFWTGDKKNPLSKRVLFLKIHVPLPILSRMWGRRRNHIRLNDMPNKCFMRDKSTTAVDILALVVTFFGCC
jgi:hypothetical protein